MTSQPANLPDPASPLEIAPVTGRIGGRVRGVQLSGDLDDATLHAIRQALARHKVLFFRGKISTTRGRRRSPRASAIRYRIPRCPCAAALSISWISIRPTGARRVRGIPT